MNFRDAASLACAFKAAAAALASKWRSAVRIGPGGFVLEPASGSFDVTVAPGEDVQAAVDACPPGGCVLLLPGTHEGPLVLGPRTMGAEEEEEDEGAEGEGEEEEGGEENMAVPPVLTADKVVHVFGRGLATLRAATGTVVTSEAAEGTLDGLIVLQDAAEDEFDSSVDVSIEGGALRMQACDISAFINIECGADPTIQSCRYAGGPSSLIHSVVFREADIYFSKLGCSC